MRRKPVPDFFVELDLLFSGFFNDLDAIIETNRKEALQHARYQAKRERNAVKARRIYTRLERVRKFDPWYHTRHISPDVFGDTHERINAVKALENKRRRIEWVLWRMYHYWMFDVLEKGAKRYGKRYTLHRKLWFKHRATHDEQLRQERWDKKRAKVKARREKLKGKKRNARRTPEETLEVLRKASRTQRVIEEAEPITLGVPDLADFLHRSRVTVPDSDWVFD